MNEQHQLRQPNTSFFPEDGIDLRKIVEQLYRHIWTILAVSFCTFFLAFLHVLTIHPTYQSTALVQIKSTSGSSMFGKLGIKSGNDSAIDTQIALMRTRYVLEPVVKQTGLNTFVSPHYFPYIGARMANHYHGNTVARPFLGLKSYAWGGEEVKIKQFSGPSAFEGQNFKLVVNHDNYYSLYTKDGNLVLTSKVGESLPSINKYGITFELTGLKARPDTEFFVGYQSPIPAANSLGRNLKVTGVAGNDPTISTGIVQLQYNDSDPERATMILNSIVDSAVTKNIQQKEFETKKTLDFLLHQLPELKGDLENAENNMNSYHSKNTTLNMYTGGQLLVKKYLMLQQSIEKLHNQREELLQIYTPLHPLVTTVEHKIAALNKKLVTVQAEIRKFPFISHEEIKLQRDVKIKNLTYMTLLSSEQQLEVIKAGVMPDIIALGDATPAVQLPTHKLLFVMAGFFLGMLLTSLIIIIRSSLSKTIDNSEQLEEELSIPVQCVIPYSRAQKKMEKTAQSSLMTLGTALSTPLILAKQEPDDISIESLRSLRVTLHIASPQAPHRIIAIMGSLSNIGKSFVSLNLAQVTADSGKRTILIDADIRKGRLNKALHKPKSNGLSEYLENKCSYESVIHSISENLDFISCGTYSRHPIELFQSQGFLDLLHIVKQQYDQVIIDTAPILPVTDGLLIAKHCDIKLLVVGTIKDTIRDVKQAVKRAYTHDIKINGIVLNHRQPSSPYGARENYRYAYTTSTT